MRGGEAKLGVRHRHVAAVVTNEHRPAAARDLADKRALSPGYARHWRPRAHGVVSQRQLRMDEQRKVFDLHIRNAQMSEYGNVPIILDRSLSSQSLALVLTT